MQITDNEQLKLIISEIKFRYNLKQSEIADKLDIKPTYLSDVINGRAPFSDSLKGNLKSCFSDISFFLSENTSDVVKLESVNEMDLDKYTLVPLYNFDAVGGMHTGNDVVDVSNYIDRYIPFADAYNDDICIPISGNSMIPVYPPGCIVLLREVHNWKDYFGFGNDFVLILNDGRRLIKNVRKVDADTVRCISYNKDYDDEELPKSFICKVFRIIKVLINVDF